MAKSFLPAAFLVTLLASERGTAQIAVSYSYTGSVQTYTVPVGAGGVSIRAAGAGGGGGGADDNGAGASGGAGATVTGSYLAAPGTVLNVYVGSGGGRGFVSSFGHTCTSSAGAGGLASGAGGLAGGAGGQAGCSGYSGGGGGGGAATVVTTATGMVLLVAGGGGGGQGGSWNSTPVPSSSSTASGTLPGSAGGAGLTDGSSQDGGDGGGGGGGGGGCPGGAGGPTHFDQTGTAYGAPAGAGASCANTAAITSFTILSTAGGAGGAGDPGSNGSTDPDGSTAGGAGSVTMTSVAGPDHYAISAAANAVNCAPTGVTIVAHTSAHAVMTTLNTITISTSTGRGDWTLTTGKGSFVAGAANSGTAIYTFALADAGSVLLALRDTYAETVTVNVSDGVATAKSGAALASEDNPISFAPSGFQFTNGANVASAIATQISGVTSTQSLALQAIRTDAKTGACTSVFASGSTVNVGIAYQCNNPTTCVAGQALLLTNNGTTMSVAANGNSALVSYTTIPLKFTTANGEAPIALNYSDAGQITLAAKYAIPLGNGVASGNVMIGSGQFVVQPYTLQLSNIALTSPGTVNPGATTATGTVFGVAGQALTVTVTAKNYQGANTPNFGQETSPATVTLTPTLVLPASGHDPPVSGSFGPYTSGAATGAAFSWPEVGIMTLTPGVANYLGSGALNGTPSGPVGRFIPNSFAVALNTPMFATACSAGGFGYLGQSFSYAVAPVVSLTALAVGGATSQNYTGAFMRLSNASLNGRNYTPTPSNPTLNLTGLPATSADPAIADLGQGQSTLTFSAGNGISFARTTAVAPFNANIALSINVIDLDGAAAANPVTFGAGNGIAFSTSPRQYYGRLTLRSALGSELLDLPMPLTVQYYLNATQGFTTNTSDSCTVAPPISFSQYVLNLQSGETCVRDSGSPGISGQGCALPASSAYLAKAAAGAFNLILAAPGTGNSGAVTVTPTAPSWLQYQWNAGAAIPTSPAGVATFGAFPGPASRIYEHEVY